MREVVNSSAYIGKIVTFIGMSTFAAAFIIVSIFSGGSILGPSPAFGIGFLILMTSPFIAITGAIMWLSGAAVPAKINRLKRKGKACIVTKINISPGTPSNKKSRSFFVDCTFYNPEGKEQTTRDGPFAIRQKGKLRFIHIANKAKFLATVYVNLKDPDDCAIELSIKQ